MILPGIRQNVISTNAVHNYPALLSANSYDGIRGLCLS